MKIAVAILVKNEANRIQQVVHDLSNAAIDTIYFFDDHSTDTTIKECLLHQTHHDTRIRVRNLLHNEDKFQFKRNEIMMFLEDKYSYVLFVDADERFDPKFLQNIQKIIQDNLEIKAFAFPRINLSKIESFPDYQVRLLKLTYDLEWYNDIHEQVYYNEKPIIETEDCLILKEYPILHYNRNTKNTRPWWNEQ